MPADRSDPWCRSCGMPDLEPELTACGRCGTPLASVPAQSMVGMTLDVRRKLIGSRPGVCVPGPDDQLFVHLEADQTVPLGDVKYEVVRGPDSVMAPVCRLFNRATAGEHAKWDRPYLWSAALTLAGSDLASGRALFDLALVEPHPNVLDWLQLSPSEKAWRTAHTAASRGDLSALVTSLSELPNNGYLGRVGLLMPYLPHLPPLRGTLEGMLERWTTLGMPGAQLVSTALFGTPRQALGAALALQQGRAEPVDGSIDLAHTPPPSADCGRWSSLRAYRAALTDRTPPPGPLLAGLPIELIEDLIDAGVVDRQSDLGSLPPDATRVILARTSPFALSVPELSAAGHVAEVARRHYLARDDAALDGLPDTAEVRHYRALRAVINGFSPAEGDLRPGARAILDQAQTDRARLAREPGGVSPAVMADPTAWPLLADVARQGHIAVQPLDEFGRWVALHRLVGLLWEGDFAEAVDLGERVGPLLPEEVEQDEVLNLVAYAKDQLGRPDDALRTLERALEGAYTHNLLVNAAVLAKRANPHSAMSLLARLVREAPSDELRVAAMCSALNVWMATPDEELPPDLVEGLPRVLQLNSNLADYHFMLRIARRFSPRTVIFLPEREGEHGGVLRLSKAHARFRDDASFGFGDLAAAYIEVHREFGRPPWFDSEWDKLAQEMREGMFVDFGTALGPTMFWSKTLGEVPGLVPDFTRMEMLPQIGAHTAWMLSESKDTLASQYYSRYFFDVYEELLASRHRLDEGSFDFLRRNLCRCMGVTGVRLIAVSRDQIADIYNDLVARANWDSEHRFALRERMREVLDLSNEPLDLLDRLIHRASALQVADDSLLDLLRGLGRDRDEWREEIVLSLIHI